MKTIHRKFQFVFFFLNILFRNGKFNFFFTENLPKKLEKINSEDLTKIFPFISNKFSYLLDYNSVLESKNLKTYKQKRFILLNLFQDFFFSNFFFRKKENIFRIKVETKCFFFYIYSFQVLYLLKIPFFSKVKTKQFFYGGDPRCFFKKKRLKKVSVKKIGNFFYRFKFLNFPNFLKKFFNCSLFFPFLNPILFFFEKYSKKFNLSKINLSFLSSFGLEISIRENRMVFPIKKTFRNSFLIKKKIPCNYNKEYIDIIYLTEAQKNLKIFKGKRRKRIESILILNLKSNKKILEEFFHLHFSRVLNGNYFKNFLNNLTKKGSSIIKHSGFFFSSFRKKKIFDVMKSLLTSFIGWISKKSGKLISKDLELPLVFFLGAEDMVMKTSRSSSKWENFGRLIFRFFSFLNKPFYSILICIYFFNLSKKMEMKEVKIHQRILTRYNTLLPWSEISLKSFKIFSRKQGWIKAKHWTSLLFCKKCKLGTFCCFTGNILKKKKIDFECESTFNISIRSFPLKISNIIQVRNYIISFYHLFLCKNFNSRYFLDLNEKLFMILTNCTGELFRKELRKKIIFAKIKKKFQSSEGFLFFLFSLDSGFLISIWPKSKPNLKSCENLKIFENFYKDPVYQVLSKCPQKISPEKISEFFRLTWKKIFVFSLDPKYISSLGPNRDTLSSEEIFRLLNNFGKKVDIKKLKNSGFFIFMSSNFSNLNKINLFKSLRFFFFQQKRKMFDFRTFIHKIILDSGKWEKKLSRTLFSFKKVFLKEMFGSFPEKLKIFLFFSFFLDHSFDSEGLIIFYNFLFEKVKRPFLFLEFSKTFTMFFDFWKEKRHLYLLREASKFFLTFKGILNLVKICFFSKRKQDTVILFSELFYSSLVIFKDPLINLNETLTFYYFLTIFSKNNSFSFWSKEGLSPIFKKLSTKIKKQRSLNIENKKFTQILNHSEAYFFLFLREFSRAIWWFYVKKKPKKEDSSRTYPLFDRSEIPLQIFSKNSDRAFKYLNYTRKKNN